MRQIGKTVDVDSSNNDDNKKIKDEKNEMRNFCNIVYVIGIQLESITGRKLPLI